MSTEVAADRRRRVEGVGLAGECVAGVVVSKVIVRLRAPGAASAVAAETSCGQVAWHDERSMLVWVCCAGERDACTITASRISEGTTNPAHDYKNDCPLAVESEEPLLGLYTMAHRQEECFLRRDATSTCRSRRCPRNVPV